MVTWLLLYGPAGGLKTRRGVNPPDLLISDVAMPQLSGFDLALQVKAHVFDCKILLFSGHAATAHLLDQAQEHGHNFTLLSKTRPSHRPASRD
jgi:DNA-binding NarL/FixJ family response regulator